MDWTCPPNVLVLKRKQVHLWRIDFRQLVIDSYLEKSLSLEEQVRANKFATPTLRNRFILTRGLLRRTLGRYLNASPSEVTIYYNDNGKPFLKEGLQFNISHSHDFAIFAIALQDNVGVDIEFMRPIEDLEEICQRFFSAAESELVTQVKKNERFIKFYDIWVRKEAYIKLLGGRLYQALESFRLENKTVYGQKEVYLYSFTTHQAYASALATSAEVTEIMYWNLNY